MDPDLYYGIEHFLQQGSVPDTISEEHQQETRRIAKGYALDKKNRLVKKEEKWQPYGPRLIVN